MSTTTHELIMPSLVEINPAVLEKIFKFCQCIFNISSEPLDKRWGPSFEQTYVLITQGCIVSSLVEIGPVILEEILFLFRQCIFAISLLLSPLGKRIGPFIRTNLNPLHPRIHCLIDIKIKLNPAVLEKFFFLNFVSVFFQFRYYLPLKKR